MDKNLIEKFCASHEVVTEYFNDLASRRTPGEWTAVAGMVETDHETAPDPCTCYADLYGQVERTDETRKQMHANAEFIAAAPDMLEHMNALQAEIARLRQATFQVGADGPSEDDLIRDGRNFGDWEAGFSEAVRIINSRMALPANAGVQL